MTDCDYLAYMVEHLRTRNRVDEAAFLAFVVKLQRLICSH